ncbi:MAG TPA: bifunctional riboflavin kinase/FAD synthetase [Ignavibacteriaceae bacterium]|nr:bifunctional riboflavin kinase/FAD synthetase [Ignavibacteriaceae bacterium]
MKIYHDISEVESNKNTILSLGTFDGIHQGHRQIIKSVVEKASINGSRNFLITFHPHPRSVISGDNAVKLLTTTEEKISILESLGIENLLIIKFTSGFSQISADEFLLNYIIKGIGLKEIVIGFDHHFGKGRSGNNETLKKFGENYNFTVSEIGECRINGETVSSTKIRKALSGGNLESANALLGRYYSIYGNVVIGDQRGRKLGFPTANIKIDKDKLLPALGIYAAEIIVAENKLFGLLSVGRRPTFYDAGEIIPEAYIFDFNKDIYGKNITVKLVERIRGEEKFGSADELIAQMKKDKETGFEILNRIGSAQVKF